MPVTDHASVARAIERDDPVCAHCALPVPRDLVRFQDDRQFCCNGCRTAFRLIRECGLERYYALDDSRRAAVVPSGRSFEEFDHETFHRLYVRTEDGASTVDLYLEGIHCASCVWLVERTPLMVDGLLRAELDIGRHLVRVTWDPDRVRLSGVARALDRLGYRPHPFRGIKAEAMRRSEDRAMLLRMAVSGGLAANIMMVTIALYGGWFTGMEGVHETFFRWVSLALTTPILLGPGRLFFRGAWSAVRGRTLHMDVPIAVALIAGYARGAYNTIVDRGPIYFDGVALLVFLLLVGRYLQQRAQRAANDSTELLHAFAPATARVVRENRADAGAIREVPLEALLPGMIVEVRDGDTVAVDGTVVSGASHIDGSLLTGESRTVAAAPGDRVFAGTVNHGSTLRVRVEQCGESSRLGRILESIESGAAQRAPLVRLTDRLAGAFVAVVLGLAAVTLALWWETSPTAAIDHAIALLIVTCPCALALATPLAVTVAIGRAARGGILIKGAEALEQLAQPGRFLLDKTGTVTEGRAQLVQWRGPDDIRPALLGLERHVNHPLAQGFSAAWPGVNAAAASAVRVVRGAGVTGRVDGRDIVIGSPGFVRTCLAGRATGAVAGEATGGEPHDPLTPVLVAVDGRVVAEAGFGDAPRPDARAVVAALERRGHRVELLSGDSLAVVRSVARAIGIAPACAHAEASPEAKCDAVEASLRDMPTYMVGDGINDAAAMARATVGIGVSGGAEACLAAADVYIATPGLGGLVQLVDGARRTLGVIHRNMAFSLIYNVAGAALAMAGLLHPLLAAVLMPVSSLTVVLASWLSRTFEESSIANDRPRRDEAMDARHRPAAASRSLAEVRR